MMLKRPSWFSSIHKHWDSTLVAFAMIVGIFTLYSIYLSNPESRWGTLDHDRNAHFLTAIQLANDVRTFDLFQLAQDLLRIRTWPPLHALLIGGWSGLFGTDYRVAVLPNMIVWGLGGLFIYRLTVALSSTASNDEQRSFEGEVAENWTSRIAGAAALFFYLSSPAHQAYAGDFMLETIGSTLTLVVLFEAIRPRSYQSSRLPFALSLLFFAKYNYWMVMIIALVICEGWNQKKEIARFVFGVDWRILLTAATQQFTQLCNLPLGLLTIYFFATEAILAIAANGSIGRPRNENLIHFIFLSGLFSVAMQWPGRLNAIWQQLPSTVKRFAIWHGVPVSIWFALPKRLGYFLWYIGPHNGANTVDRSIVDSMQFYWLHASKDYHAIHGAILTALLLATIACLFVVRDFVRDRKITRCGLIVLFLTVAMCLTLNHANQKARFLHTFIPAFWCLSGVGVSSLIRCWLKIEETYLKRLSRFMNARSTSIRGLVLGGWCCCLLFGLVSIDGGRATESARYASPSSLEISEQYMPWLEETQRPAILGTLPIEYFAEWTYITRFPERPRPWTTAQMRWFAGDASVNQQRLDQWLDVNHPESIVLVDVGGGSPVGFPDFEYYSQIKSIVAARSDYHCVQQKSLHAHACELSLWKINR